MDLELKGKTVIVTGTGSHIGRAIAMGFSKEGCNVSMLEIDEERGKKVAEEVRQAGPGGTLLFQTDVTKLDQIQKAVNDTLQKFGTIDILVDNVGAGTWGGFLDRDIAGIDKDITLNLWSQIYCLHTVLPHMIARKAGTIVNLTSGAGVQGVATLSPYSAAKAGVIGLTQALARELGPLGIRLNCVAPGTIPPTGIDYRNRHLKIEERRKSVELGACIKRVGEAQDIADAVLFLASNRASYITGQTLNVNGGMHFR